MNFKIYGYSDDLIEIDGDLREEFSCYLDDNEAAIVGISDGTLLRINFDEDGIWRIVCLRAGDLFTGITPSDPDDDDAYTDTAKFASKERGKKIWAVYGTQYVISGR